MILVSDKADKQKAYNELTEMLENGVKDVFTSERYKEYLNFVSKFHNYSHNNTLLIMLQNPDATFVASYTDWNKKHNRHIKKGEKGIKIFAPSPYKVKLEVPVYDDNKIPVVIDGKPLTEVKEIQKLGFKAVSVFDVSQTDGEPFIVPDFGNKELTADIDNYSTLFESIRSITDYNVIFDNITTGAKGLCSYNSKTITINNGMSQAQNIKTLLHEIAHSRLHDPNVNADRPNRDKREVQAESIAFVVANKLGLDTAEYSFDYIAGWSSNRETKELKESLEVIQKEASAMITTIQEKYQELIKPKEKEIPLDTPLEKQSAEIVQEAPTAILEPSNLPAPDTVTYEQMAEYGYTSQEMLPISPETANWFAEFVSEIPLYELRSDNTEALFDRSERIKDDMFYGVEKTDWERICPKLFIEPHVKVLWSEHSHELLKDDTILSLNEADVLFANCDLAAKNTYVNGGYDKTKFAVFYVSENVASGYIDRQDFGDGDGSLINHINMEYRELASYLKCHAHINKFASIKGFNQAILSECRNRLNQIPIAHNTGSDVSNTLYEIYDTLRKEAISFQKRMTPNKDLQKGDTMTAILPSGNIESMKVTGVLRDSYLTEEITLKGEKISYTVPKDRVITEKKQPNEPKYSKEENARIVAQIKEIPIQDYAQALGFTVQNVGTYYTLKEHDSVRINPSKNRFVRNSTGAKGSVIDFVMEFEKLDKPSAISKLAEYIGSGRTLPSAQVTQAKATANSMSDKLTLPPKAGNMRNVFAYLINTRKIDPQIVSQWVHDKNLYQDIHKNCVFVTYDKNGNPEFASQRGTNTHKPFKADIEGSNYDTCHFINNNASKLVVCESMIDLMSVQTILQAKGRDLKGYNYLSLNGVTKTNAILNALKNSPTDTVILATDNDNAGRLARIELQTLISEYDKNIKTIEFVPQNAKDWNAELIVNVSKEEQSMQSEQPSLEETRNHCEKKSEAHNSSLTHSDIKEQNKKQDVNLD